MAKIIGRGAPTDKTYGILGQEYMDKLTGKRYICIKSATVTSDKAGEADHICEWVEESAGGGASSWNDLKDKPFGDDTPEPITWDGEIGERECVVNPDDESFKLVKVSDIPLSVESLIGGEFTITPIVAPSTARVSAPPTDDITFTITEDDIESPMDGFLIVDSDAILSIDLDSLESVPGVVLTRGVYFTNYSDAYVSKLTFAPQVKKLDDQYLPPVTKFYRIDATGSLYMAPYLSEESTAHSRDIDNALARGPIVIYEVSSGNPDYIKRIMCATTIVPGEDGYAIIVTLPGGDELVLCTGDYVANAPS